MSTAERPAEGKDHEKTPLPPEPVVGVPEAVRERVRAQASPVRCPFCHDDVRVGEQRWVACAGCLARHHSGCWGEAGRCAACGDAASLAGGGGSRSRAIAAAAVVGVMLLLFLGIQFVVQREFTDLRRDLAELTARPPAAAPAAPPAAPSAPYLGESPAVAALRVAAHAGDARAAHDLSLALDEGRDVVPNRAEARRWLEVAADRGDARAMRSLAAALAPTVYGAGDAPKAVFWLRRALAAEYDADAARSLASLLQASDPERRPLLERLAGDGSGEAMIELGQVERGREALRAAADRGDGRARRQLHELEETGRFRFGWHEDEGPLPSYRERVAEPRPDEAEALLKRWAAEGDQWAADTLVRVGGGVLSFDDEDD